MAQNRTLAVIYVSRNNPLETKPESQGGIGLLIFFMMAIFSFAHYKSTIKEQERISPQNRQKKRKKQ